jgi:hypothetical protein
LFDQTRARSSAQRQGDLFQSRTLPPGTARIPRSRFRQPFGEDLLSALVVVAEEPAYPQLDPNRNSLPGKIAQSPLVPAMHAAGGSPARRTDALLPRRPQPHDEPAPPLSREFLRERLPQHREPTSAVPWPLRRVARAWFQAIPDHPPEKYQLWFTKLEEEPNFNRR